MNQRTFLSWRERSGSGMVVMIVNRKHRMKISPIKLSPLQVRDRKGVKTTTRELEDMEYDVSLLGGYADEEEISQDITEMLLVVMQVFNFLRICNLHSKINAQKSSCKYTSSS